MAVSGPLVGILIGWMLHRHADHAPAPTALQQRIEHVCTIDQRISSALASLHAYEERLRIGAQLSENGSASTKPCSIGSGTDDLGMGLGRPPLREPLDGKTLLDIKQATDNHIRECTSALTRATLEAQETNGEASSEAMGACVSALHESRAQFLRTARTRLGLDALTEETEGRIEALAEKAFSPSHLSRPYVAAGVRLPEERR